LTLSTSPAFGSAVLSTLATFPHPSAKSDRLQSLHSGDRTLPRAFDTPNPTDTPFIANHSGRLPPPSCRRARVNRVSRNPQPPWSRR
jgi:hypothetical protein